MNADDKLEMVVQKSRSLLDNMPGFFYIKTLASKYLYCSAEVASATKIKTKKLVGRTDDAFPWEEFCTQYQQDDNNAIDKKISDVLQPIPVSNSLVLTSRCVKNPIYDDLGNPIGIFGRATIFAGCKNIKEAIACIFLMNKSKKHDVFDDFPGANLTNRESECLFLILRGKTTKDIAKFLEVSPRTVETHIDHIKIKLGVCSKSEIIHKAIELGLVDVIPKNSVLRGLSSNPKKWRDVLYFS